MTLLDPVLRYSENKGAEAPLFSERNEHDFTAYSTDSHALITAKSSGESLSRRNFHRDIQRVFTAQNQ